AFGKSATSTISPTRISSRLNSSIVIVKNAGLATITGSLQLVRGRHARAPADDGPGAAGRRQANLSGRRHAEATAPGRESGDEHRSFPGHVRARSQVGGRLQPNRA